jgi:hypothetical protein
MKKSVVIAVLGAAGFAVSSYGQGVIQFDTYAGSYNGGSIAQVSQLAGGAVVADGIFSGELYYAFGTVSDPVSATAASITQAISAQFTALPSSVTAVIGGYIQDGTQVQIPGYTATTGPITFEIGFVGSNGQIGRSGSFTESSINVLGVPATTFGANGPGPGQMLVASVPEPTTLALAGLGGLASLIALRRKQA